MGRGAGAGKTFETRFRGKSAYAPTTVIAASRNSASSAYLVPIE